jgi:uncharacterized protein YfaS (alpha-2-macroglobulin family)
VRIELMTVDANERPLSAAGRVTVTRERWVEVWLDPAGREVRGEDLEKVRRRAAVFPPPPAHPGDPGWRLVFEGYERDEILERLVRTDAEGRAEVEFTPQREGFYRLTWTGDEEADFPVETETTVWVADRDTRAVGYHQGGVEILVDRDTVRAGQTTPVMLSAPVAGAWVLFTVEGEDVYDWRVVHLEGRVKLIELEIEPRHMPNVYLEATMIHDARLFLDSAELIVPPVDKFLDVALEFEREAYEPGERARLRLATRDRDGRPVSAEVALALVDDSVFYIQQDQAGDPRRFFYGTRRWKAVNTTSTFHQRPYVRLSFASGDPLRDRPTGIAANEIEGGQERADFGMAQAATAWERRGAKALVPAPAADALERSPELESAVAGSEVQVRTDFRATALWEPAIVTDADGRATVEVDLPQSLTSWRATARAAGRESRFGIVEASTQTSKALIARLQAPRFLVAGDEGVVSTVINNNTGADLEVAAALDVEGLELVEGPTGDRRLVVPAGGERRADWRVAVRRAGLARLTTRVRAGELADAMSLELPLVEHGIEKLLYRSGKLQGDSLRLTLDLPPRRPLSTTMTVQVTPSLAATMLDALPYLIDYPYGCTEQTMSRFLPSVIVARTMESLGIDREVVATRLFGGIDAEHAGRTHPEGPRALDELEAMVRRGLERLYDFQHADGGWGWWREGESDHYMTAYVVWGLGLADQAGVELRQRVMERGIAFLERELVEREEQPDLQAWMLHAVVSASPRPRSASPFREAALENLWNRRDRLSAYTRALLALAAKGMGRDERATVLVRNLVNGVERDRAPDRSALVGDAAGGDDSVVGTAHWGEAGFYHRWSRGAVESTAFVLRALLTIDPDNELIEPATHWLIRNRRGAQWSNTRDTAIAVLALNDYLLRSGELSRSVEYDLWVNGSLVASGGAGEDDVLGGPSLFAVTPERIRDGVNEIRLVRRRGDAPIYYAVEARLFSLEEPITPAGHEVFVRRSYHRLVPTPTLLDGYRTARERLGDEGRVTSGERVEVVLTIEAKNDYEYLVIEDLKPAGLEAVELRSGEPLDARELRSDALARDDGTRATGDYTGRTRRVYRELRDRKIALFLDRLPQGVWEIRYELRAEVPGAFHALPAMIHAMYVPEIRANGRERLLDVEDRSRGPLRTGDGSVGVYVGLLGLDAGLSADR